MAAPTAVMTVLHLESGHVLAAVSSGSRKVTVADLTGGKHLSVRLPDSADQVTITADLLTATEVALDADVIDRPLEYVVGQGVPPLSYAGPPIDLAAGTIGAPAGTEAVSFWQVGNELEVARNTLTAAGKPDGTTPTGATHRLVACVGEPLAYEP